MKQPIARIGDTSTHNGRIITSCKTTKAEGKLVARVNDMHQCPIEGHGITPIITGSPNHIVEGQKTARTSSMTGCGAMIIGGCQKTFCD